MGPCGLVASYLHWYPAPQARQADRGAGSGVAGPAGVAAAGAPGPMPGCAQRHQQSSARICIEHTIAEPKQWRPLQRWTGRREYLQETALAIAGLVSDRAAAR